MQILGELMAMEATETTRVNHYIKPIPFRIRKPERQVYPDNLFRYKALIPKEVCQEIKEHFPDRPSFILNLLAHVVGSGGQAVAPGDLLRHMGGPNGTTLLANLTNRSLKFFDRSGYSNGQDGTDPYARHYRLRREYEWIFERTSGYARWSDYTQRRRERTLPVNVFDQHLFTRQFFDNGGEIQLPEELLVALDKMSRRKIYFDYKSARADDSLTLCPYNRVQINDLAIGELSSQYKLQASGRIGTIKHNLQTIKRDIRKYVYPAEGYSHLYFDYSSQEPRIVAYLSGDEKMRELLDTDIYTVIKNKFGLYKRSDAKIILNAAVNGVSEWSIANESDVNISQEKARQCLDYLDYLFPQARYWRNKTSEDIFRNEKAITVDGTVRTNFTRGINGDMLTSSADTEGISHVVQGSGADILRRLLIILDKELDKFGSYPLLPMHDGILIETPDSYINEVELLTKKIMLEVPQDFFPGIHMPVKSMRSFY